MAGSKRKGKKKIDSPAAVFGEVVTETSGLHVDLGLPAGGVVDVLAGGREGFRVLDLNRRYGLDNQ